MAKKKENKEILENPEAITDKIRGVEHWIEDNPRIFLGVLAVIVFGVAGYFGYGYYKDSQEDDAQRRMFQAVRYFESDSVKLALNGDGNNLGFLKIIDEYSGTPAANLAHFYVGVINLNQGNLSSARTYLKEFESGDQLVQARAWSLIGDTYMDENNFSEAATWYGKASGHKPNKQFTPIYMLKQALAYEKLKQNDKAVGVYQKLVDEYGDSEEAKSAKKYMAVLQVK